MTGKSLANSFLFCLFFFLRGVLLHNSGNFDSLVTTTIRPFMKYSDFS